MQRKFGGDVRRALKIGIGAFLGAALTGITLSTLTPGDAQVGSSGDPGPQALGANQIAVGNCTTGCNSTGASAQIGPVGNKMTFLCGIDVTINPSTTAGDTNVGVGTFLGTVNLQYWLTFGTSTAQAGQSILIKEFKPCLPGNGPGVGISATATSSAAVSNMTINLHGYVN